MFRKDNQEIKKTENQAKINLSSPQRNSFWQEYFNLFNGVMKHR